MSRHEYVISFLFLYSVCLIIIRKTLKVTAGIHDFYPARQGLEAVKSW